MDSREKAKKNLEGITGLPITSDKKEGRKRVFTSTVHFDSKGNAGQKGISFGINEKRKKREELKEEKFERRDDKKEWKTYSHSEKWTDPEGNVDVEVKTTATGDFDFDQEENNGSAEISELTEEEARKLEEQGIKVEKPFQERISHETSSKSKSKAVNKTPFISGLIVVCIVGLVGMGTLVISRKG